MVSDACLLVASVFKKEKIVVVTHDQLCVNGLLKIEKHRFFFDVFLCFSVFFLCFFDFLFLFCKTMCDPTLADLTHCLVSVIRTCTQLFRGLGRSSSDPSHGFELLGRIRMAI